MLPLLVHTRSKVTPSAQMFCHLKIRFANYHPRTLWVVNREDLIKVIYKSRTKYLQMLPDEACFILTNDYTTLFSLCFGSIEIT